jgi:hypothetical protein
MADQPQKAPVRGLAFAAVLLTAGYALVNLEKTTQTIQALTGGGLNWTTSGTRTMSYDNGAFTLETYWSSGRLHYRASTQMSAEQLRKAKERRLGGAGMDLWLNTWFGQDVIRVEIPAAAFETDAKDSGRVVAAGSVEVSEADYWEIVHSMDFRAANRFAD